MKGIYFTIILIFLAGVGTSLYLILSPEDYALMLLKGEKYSEAENYYSKKYLQGDRSISTLIPLKTLEINKGDNQKAIALMQEYLITHPDDLYAKKLLGVLYLNGMRREEYVQNLEEISRMSANAELLSELAEWYHLRGNQEREQQVLEDILKRGYGKEKHYFSLAHLLASRGQYQEAYALMELRRRLFEKENQFESVRFEIALLLEMGHLTLEKKNHDQTILKLAHHYLLQWQDPKKALAILSQLKSQHREDLAIQLKPSLHYLAHKDLDLTTEIIELEWISGDQERAYQELLQIYRNQPLSIRLANLFVLMSLKKQYFLMVSDIIDHIEPKNLSQTTLLEIAKVSATLKYPLLADKLKRRLDSFFLKKNPTLNAAIALASHDPQGSTLLQILLQGEILSSEEAFTLMLLAIEQGLQEEALKIGKKLFPLDQMSSTEWIEWALTFIRLKQTREALKILFDHQNRIGQNHEGGALALIYTDLGKIEWAESWLSTQKKPPEYLLINLYLLAEKNKLYPFALQVASKLYTLYPSSSNQFYLASAFFNQGHVSEALGLFRELLQVDLPSFEIVMGYLKALQILEPDNKSEISFYVAQLLKGHLTKPQLRDLGYFLLDKVYDFAQAEVIFAQLASQTHFEISDIEAYLFILGPKPKQEIVAWITALASHSSKEENIRWVKALRMAMTRLIAA